MNTRLTFSEYLIESMSAPSKVLKHIEHIEDLIWSHGLHHGMTEFQQYIESILTRLYNPASNKSSGINLSIKFDGSPSIVCGIDPETKKPFLATKSLFNKTPKINYTKEDLDRNHSHIGVLYEIIDHLPRITKGKILQGDLLYTPSTLMSEVIDGQDHWVFQPNTIKYAVPKNSPLGNQISQSKFGVVWHTQYKGKTLTDIQSSVYRNSEDHTTKDVVCFPSQIQNISSRLITESEFNDIRNDMNRIQGRAASLGNTPSPWSEGDLRLFVFPVINAIIRESASTEKLNKNLADFVEKLKEKPKIPQKLIDAVVNNKVWIREFITCYYEMILLKNKVIGFLNRVGNIRSLIPTGDGWKVSSGEGYVAVDIRSGSLYKLVDRIEFSRTNFLVNRK